MYFNFNQDKLWLCSDLSSDWARDLLEKNEHLRERLRFLNVDEMTWKTLNPAAPSSSVDGVVHGTAIDKVDNEPVSGLMNALEEVKFH